MAQFTVNAQRFDPYKNFKFRVKWDGRYVAGISKVGALKKTTEVVDHREGGDPSTVRRSPAQSKYKPITLERGVTHDTEFEKWANKAWNFGSGLGSEVSRKDFRKDCIIDMYNEAGQLAISYKVYRCWVSEFQALPELDASANAIAIQTLTLQNEGWERDTEVIEPSESLEVIRETTPHKLGELAHLLECPFQWADIILPEYLKSALKDFVIEARERKLFWEKDNVRQLFPQGRGLIAMFSGPTGTGKTMAAQVFAAELKLDLFRVDLSTIVSKYVGETSQNLERILAQAEHMDIVLLFDEADALFGKRTEVRDAHDRFANTDTKYLLQAIENYRGIALLSTNKKENVDTAFIRRLGYVLEFPKPDVNQREQIWTGIIRKLVTDKHFQNLKGKLNTLANIVELTGAQIKSTILYALFIAKTENKSLNMTHLMRGLDRELMKEGRSLSKRKRGKLMEND